jgi:diacylglycerol kinase (ATP)
MTSVAVVAHRGKGPADGLQGLRRQLVDRGFDHPLWFEVDKSKRAGKCARQAIDDGADLLIAWGGDGTVQRCVDAVAGTGVDLGILPVGTANLFANNFGIPLDLPEALNVALHGARRRIDVGNVNGERFGVMAGAGFDALMIKDASRSMKNRLGRLAYVWTGARAARESARAVNIKVDGQRWFKGDASCVLIGNVGTISGGFTVFPDARADDGWLEVGVVTADGMLDWTRVLGRVVTGHAAKSPMVDMAQGRKIDIKFETKTVYELDGGDRPRAKRLEIFVEPAAVSICVPSSNGSGS